MGGFAVSFAKWGEARVIVTVGSEEQAEVALEAGADHALNYRTDDVATRVWEITGGWVWTASWRSPSGGTWP